MRTVQITALRQLCHEDLIQQLELPQKNPCGILAGSQWISQDAQMPNGFCIHAWSSLYPYVLALANSTDVFFDGWMKKPGTALVSCSDGFRPMSFLLEAMKEEENI